MKNLNHIEEAHLLKTDLLGDAIESALSETGGTKDVGLFSLNPDVNYKVLGVSNDVGIFLNEKL